MRKIRVGFDGKALTNINRMRGIGHYTRNLLGALLKAESEFHFVVFGYGDSPPSDLLRWTPFDELEWAEIPNGGAGTEYTPLREYWAYAKAVNRSGVRIFHGIDHNTSPFFKCRTLITVHDLILLILRGPYLGPRSFIWMEAAKAAALRASAVVAVSNSTRRDLERIWGVEPSKIHVVYEGVDARYAPVADSENIEDSLEKYGIKKPYFLYLGGFDPRKNIRNMLLGFKRFALNEKSEHRIVLCGNHAGFEEYLKEEIEDLGLESRAIIPGYVSDEDLPCLYSGADATLFTSIYEGFGLPALESMACGTPVIASRTSSLPEVVGGAGLLVDPLDPHDIELSLRRIVLDKEECERLVEMGLKRADAFKWEKAASRIIELYRMLSR